MKKNVYVISDENLEYIAKLRDDKITLRRSKSEIWSDSCKEEVVATLLDSGNDIIIKIGDTKLILDYSNFDVLRTIVGIKFEYDRDLTQDKVLAESR